jgi:predicted outer membrane protein
VFGLVEAGCRRNQEAGQLAYNLVSQLAQAGEAPPELRALGKTLQRILEGLRGEAALAGLPAELRPPVEELLRRLG